MSRLLLPPTLLVPVLAIAAPQATGEAPEAPAARSPKLQGWGRLSSPLKDRPGTYRFTLYHRDPSGKLQKTAALLEVPETAEILMDRPVGVRDVKKDETAFALGRPSEQEVRRGGSGPGGAVLGGMDRQIQAARLFLCGEVKEVNERFKLPGEPDLKWCQGTLKEDGAKGLWLLYSGGEYKVVLTRGAPVLRRSRAERKHLRRGAYLQIEAAVRDPPEGEEPLYAAQRVVILEPRAARSWPLYLQAAVPQRARETPAR